MLILNFSSHFCKLTWIYLLKIFVVFRINSYYIELKFTPLQDFTMNLETLIQTAQALVAPGKGLLAMDESNTTCNKRFAAIGIPQIEPERRAYREMILTTPNLGQFISGAILYDETIRQHTKNGTPFLQLLTQEGIIPGIKVDEGAKNMALHPGEKITEGLDNLRERLSEYSQMGARFAKWRAVITIGDNIPTAACLKANAHALARYAALCQEANIVPIVEPEVLMDGSHSLEKCKEVSEKTLQTVFKELTKQQVILEGIILKPNMVLPGIKCSNQESLEKIVNDTLICLLRCVPAAVPGIAFLSGGQSPELATTRLNAMNQKMKGKAPWSLTFSFSRAILQPALEAWKGKESNIQAAHQIIYNNAKNNSAASLGQFNPK